MKSLRDPKNLLSGFLHLSKTADTREGATHEILLRNEILLHNAAKNNNLEVMEQLLKENVNLNAQNNLKRTALHFAVAGNHYHVVEFLLKNQAQVNIADQHGLMAIHLAAWNADLNIMVILLKAGANQKATNEDGMNALHFAAQNKNDAIMRYLVKDLQLQHLNTLDKKGRKPFHLAAEKGHLEMINTLIELDLFTSEKDLEGNTALHLAAKNGHSEVLQVLIEEPEKKEEGNAAKKRSSEISEDLINRWENLDEQNENGETAFYLAAEGGHEKCAELLADARCDINISTKDSSSPLHAAAENGHLSLVKFLLSKDVDVTPKPEHKNSPLHRAIKNDHSDVVQILLEAKIETNTLDQRQQTPLHLAADLRNIEMVEMLLKAGCDLHAVDKQGKTALNVASRSNHTLIVDMIIKAQRYYDWLKDRIETGQEVYEDSLSFKQDHSVQTSLIRSALWNLSYNRLKPQEWKKLAYVWMFTEAQIKAVEDQWTGTKSYKEHGNRMLLIWLNGVLLAHQNPVKNLYEDLVRIGHPQIAGKTHFQFRT
ncbi:hypothetical protein NDU88_004635 [Pleurodeles waltl]|uniref:Death domain-containing protein n=1 Tax=Pleurodeles waltl TaxID=8319 RepID=A0AAV7W5T7_PLEWA|nr:hypothetical protein NDU88_004635 [Pleurodeles waltl]